jgi:hypothetical protein
MILFSELMNEFQNNIQGSKTTLNILLKRSPNLAYQKINDLAYLTGSKYRVNLRLHFPDPKKISDLESYGTENIGMVVDSLRTVFPISRQEIKQKAIEIIGSLVTAQDAYMYKGKEGVKITLPRGRIEILPGSIHVWCQIDEKVKKYCDWLMQNVYFR